MSNPLYAGTVTVMFNVTGYLKERISPTYEPEIYTPLTGYCEITSTDDPFYWDPDKGDYGDWSIGPEGILSFSAVLYEPNSSVPHYVGIEFPSFLSNTGDYALPMDTFITYKGYFYDIEGEPHFSYGKSLAEGLPSNWYLFGGDEYPLGLPDSTLRLNFTKVSPVPEPTTILLLGSGLLGLVGFRRKINKS